MPDEGGRNSVLGSDRLLCMIARGLGLRGDAGWSVINSAFSLQHSTFPSIPALSFDLAFPEVFYPDANPVSRVGFDADLGNPPWDAIQFKSKEFLASFDLNVLEAATKHERELTERRLLSDKSCRRLFDQYKEAFEETKRANDALYRFQKVEVDGDLAGRQLDAFRVFMERAYQVLRAGGRTGVVVPSAFHANEGATGVRRLYLQQMSLHCCFSFENRRGLFEIHRSFKFAAIVAEKGLFTTEFPCAFYLHDDEWLFNNTKTDEPLRFTADFVTRTGGAYLNFLELRSKSDASAAATCYANGVSCGRVLASCGMHLQGPPAALHMSHESERFATAPGVSTWSEYLHIVLPPGKEQRTTLSLFEGKHFRDFCDQWGPPPRYLVPIANLQDRPAHIGRARHYQLAVRAIARSTDDRTLLAAFLPPGTVCGHSVFVDSETGKHLSTSGLHFLACLNSFTLDWVCRQLVAANVTLFVLRNLPMPDRPNTVHFLAHAALRLTCNHAGYEPLWREQMGDRWREAGTAFTWPVLSGEGARWAVRASIDAVVAHAYGLTSDQYAHVLSTFSHSSYKDAPRQCLAAFAELQFIGLEAFTQRHDPYWDIPLNENLPQPVIELPMPATEALKEEPSQYHAGEFFDFQTTPAPAGSGRLFTEQPVPRHGRRKK